MYFDVYLLNPFFSDEIDPITEWYANYIFIRQKNSQADWNYKFPIMVFDMRWRYMCCVVSIYTHAKKVQCYIAFSIWSKDYRFHKNIFIDTLKVPYVWFLILFFSRLITKHKHTQYGRSNIGAEEEYAQQKGWCIFDIQMTKEKMKWRWRRKKYSDGVDSIRHNMLLCVKGGKWCCDAAEMIFFFIYHRFCIYILYNLGYNSLCLARNLLVLRVNIWIYIWLIFMRKFRGQCQRVDGYFFFQTASGTH